MASLQYFSICFFNKHVARMPMKSVLVMLRRIHKSSLLSQDIQTPTRHFFIISFVLIFQKLRNVILILAKMEAAVWNKWDDMTALV